MKFSKVTIAPSLISLFCASQAIAGEAIIYQYDDLGRLIRVTQTGAINNGVTTDIAYDAAGNRTDYNTSGSNGSGSDGGATDLPGSGGGVAPSFSVSNATVTEGGVLTFTISKDQATFASYGVNYSTENGSAEAGSDYVFEAGALVFAGGDLSKSINVGTIDDNLVEQIETVFLNINAVSGNAVIGDGQGVGTISDDDASNNAPTVVNESFGVSCAGGVYNVLANDTDPDGDAISLSVKSGQPLGARQSGANAIKVNGTTQPGTYVIGYVVTDIQGASATGGLTLTWVNNPSQCSIGGGPLQ